MNAEEARYLVVGAIAMQLWGTTRATRDVDILIDPTMENADRVLRALGHLPFGVAAEFTAADVISRGVTMIGDTPNVEIITRAWNLQWRDAERDVAVFTVDGVAVPTVSIRSLIESKRTGRLQDLADIQVLEELQRLRSSWGQSRGKARVPRVKRTGPQYQTPGTNPPPH
ncbi:hypothetical protein, partial [Gemmatimonas sp.]|uniref:hypothetical protein n=1 Tax=Gemmatimonas sp. TaxID=1962908 RepID=UPI00286B6BBA